MKRRTAKALKRAVAGMHFKTCGRSVTGVCTGGLPHAHRLKLSCAYGSFSLAGTRAFQVHILVQAHTIFACSSGVSSNICLHNAYIIPAPGLRHRTEEPPPQKTT